MALSEDLPPKSELLDSCPKNPLLCLDIEFDDLRECSLVFQKAFMEAWKAIKNGSWRRLKDSVETMKSVADEGMNSLDVCYLQSITHSEERVLYYMTLLAHAAVNRQKGMVKYLLEQGAKSQTGNGISGSPLTQVLVYASLFTCPKSINMEIIQLLCDIPLNIETIYLNVSRSPVELAIDLRRFDVVKLLIQSGAHPIDPSIPTATKPVSATQLLEEYYEFGTNHYLTWLLHEHLLSDNLPDFIDTVVNLDILSGAIMKKFAGVGRHPAHAILTCGHEDMIRKFIEMHGAELLICLDEVGKSALMISAEIGDLDSVNLQLNLRRELGCSNSDDITAALLAASMGNHRDIAKCILQMDTSVMPRATEKMEDLACAFQVLRDLNPTLLLHFPIAHYAAKKGIVGLFKIVFHLPCLGENMFEALTKSDGKGKTPLQLAIEENHLSILRVLRERAEERESQSIASECDEQKAWEKLWLSMGPEWLLQACHSGSVEAVKFFIELGCSPNYESIEDGRTPLSCASMAGKDETVSYLLGLEQIEIPKHSKHSPILLAAEYGHAKCVELLLDKGANVNEICPTSKFNSLMLAVHGKHHTTALTILSDKKQGLSALQFRCDHYKTPMRMLIQHMPMLAEWVLNNIELDTSEDITNYREPQGGAKNVLKLTLGLILPDFMSPRASTSAECEKMGCYFMEDKFDLVEDFQSPKRSKSRNGVVPLAVEDDKDCRESDWRPKYYDASKHPLQMMVDFERENLLNHPLVKELIDYKWKRISIPGFLIYLGVYLLFLILLTSYALTLPPPGTNTNQTATYTASGLSQSDVIFLYFAAVLCIIFDIIYLTLEVIQLARRRLRYLKEFDNYFQVLLNILALIFVFPVGHEDWILPSWRWQIGAIVLFLGWLNCTILLKSMPYFGVNITMLFSVGFKFVSLIYLPVLLMITFGFPFYMLLAFDPSFFEGGRAFPLLQLFTSPYGATWNMIVQTAGYVDSSAFNGQYLLYPVLSAILYVMFLFIMVILFNSFLIGIAVGETSDERERANITIIKEKIGSVFELEESLPFLRHYFFKRRKATKRLLVFMDEYKRRDFEAKNKSIRRKIEEKRHTENLKQNVSNLTDQVYALKENLAQTRAALSSVQAIVSKQLPMITKDYMRKTRT